MRRAIIRVASAVGVCAAIVVSHPFGTAASPPLAAQMPRCNTVMPVKSGMRGTAAATAPLSHYDTRVNASFVVRIDAERRAQVVVKSNDLEVVKSVAPDGSFTLALTAGDDRVEALMQKAGLDVSRGGATQHLEFGQAGEEALLAVQRLLSGSKAVRMHHILAANLEPNTLSRPGGAATLLTDVFLGLLGGDVAAIDRFGRELGRRRHASAGTLLRARFGKRDGDSCYVRWENEVMESFYQYVACRSEYSVWNPMQEICNIRYYMRTECAWWELISCCAIPLRAQ